MTELRADDALIPQCGPSPYLHLDEVQEARRRFLDTADHCLLWIRQLEREIHARIDELFEVREHTISARDELDDTLLLVAQQQLIRARALGDIPAAATALQEITDLTHH